MSHPPLQGKWGRWQDRRTNGVLKPRVVEVEKAGEVVVSLPPKANIKCPLCRSGFKGLTAFVKHCHKRHGEVMDKEVDVETVRKLTKSQEDRELRDQEVRGHVK